MPIVYYVWRSDGKHTFQVNQRLQDILAGRQAHPHYNNYTTHGGHGGAGRDYIPPYLLTPGHAVYALPTQAYGYWTEVVWNPPGWPAGVTRVILGTNDEIYFTTDHYHIYYRVYKIEGQAKHTKFLPSGAKHTKFL